MEIINGRFRIQQQIDRDFSSTSYIAVDLLKNHERVMIRVFEPDYSDKAYIRYLIEENIFLASIEHENILRNETFDIIYTIDQKDVSIKQYFCIKEYLPHELIHYMMLSKEERIAVFMEICEAIRYLHFRGIVYHYLTLDHIFIYRENGRIKIKLIDYAYTREIERDRRLLAHCSNQFLSPEYQLGLELGTSNDIFSLGVVFFFLYFGLDYGTCEFSDKFYKIENTDDIVLSMIDKMTAFDTTERYKNIHELIADIRKIFTLQLDSVSDRHKTNYEKLNFKLRLVHREKEMSTIFQAVEDIIKKKSKPSAIFIEGETGVGKSRLLKEVLYKLRMEKIQHFFIGYRETSLREYQLIIDILEDIIMKNTNYDLIQKYGCELVKILPGIGEKWGISPSAPLSGEKERLRLNDRICNFILDAIGLKPTIIVIDNIQHVDDQSLEILYSVLSTERKLSLLLVASCRQKESCFSNLGKSLDNPYGMQDIQLSTFSLQETAAFIQQILGMAWKPLPLAARIIKETDGNPRYIEDMLKNLFINRLIGVNEKYLWVAKVNDLADLRLSSNIDETFFQQMSTYDETSKEILRVMSVFHSSVSSQLLAEIIHVELLQIMDKLKYLTEMKIINERVEDWGLTYDYESRKFKLEVYAQIVDEKKSEYHQKVAQVLERTYVQEGRINLDELIHHFKKCSNYHKAIDYCIQSGERMLQLNIHVQALEFYKKAIELLQIYREDDKKVNVLLQLASIYDRLGETDKALSNYDMTIQAAQSLRRYILLVDALNKKAGLYLKKHKTSAGYDIIIRAMDIADQHNYDEGYLESGLLLSYLYYAENDFQRYKDAIDDFMQKSLEICNYHYIGEFLVQEARCLLHEGHYDDGLMKLIDSITYFEKASSSMGIIKSFNYIGELLIEGSNHIELARNYFQKALDKAEKQNCIEEIDLYHLNIGKTYLIDDAYHEAIRLFQAATKASEEREEYERLLWGNLYLFEAYMRLGEYAKAYNYFTKAEKDSIWNDLSNNKKLYEYYNSLKCEFYFALGSMDRVRQCMKNIGDMKQNASEFFEFKIILYKIFIDADNNKYSMELNSVLDIINQYDYQLPLKQIRIFLLFFAYHYLENGNYDSAGKLLDKDEELSQNFDTKYLQLVRRLYLGYFEKEGIGYYESLLKEVENDKILEFEWKIHNKMGDEYTKSGDYYNAINSYISSLDILKQLLLKIPDEFQLDYLNSDMNKLVLKNKIRRIKNKILYRQDSNKIEKDDTQPLKEGEIDAFFDFTEIEILFHNQSFLETALKEYESFFPVKAHNIRDLVQILTSDNLKNIEFILKYCVQTTLAKRGFVMIVDENHEIQHMVSLDNQLRIPKVQVIIERIKQTHEGVLLKNLYNNKSEQHYDFLPDRARAAICIPIKRNNGYDPYFHDNRRKSDGSEFHQMILGYLYLDTDKVFNNFNWSTFKTCSALSNLMHLEIDNYQLKVTASIDKMTNVYLRKHFEKALKDEFFKSRKHNTDITIVMCDLDRFKQINDTYGHRKGDEILKKVTHIIRKNVRSSDIVGRYGGEEFIILLPLTVSTDAYSVCEKIRKSIADAKLLGESHSVTMSFGIASYPEHGYVEDELIEKADQALYHAKKMGRNQTVIWSKGIYYHDVKVDRLTGVITGNDSQDIRNVREIIEAADLLKAEKPKEQKLFQMLGKLIQLTDAKQGMIMELQDKKLMNKYGREKFSDCWQEHIFFNEKIIHEVIEKGAGSYMIDWEGSYKADRLTGIPDWQSLIIQPLYNNGKLKGVLQLSVPMREKEFDLNAFNFVNAFTGIIGAIL
ncbi:MAG: diguanylate cyclase [Bacillota bacterium]